MNGTTHLAKVTRSWGGVGRNIAECLYRLGADPILLTALDETTNRSVEPFSLFECRSPPSNGHSNASYSAVLDHKGECRIGLGDMTIHDAITPQWILENRSVFKDTPLIVMDGNISIPTMECILDLAEELNKPVFFEPTDARKAIKPFKTKSWKSIKYITPNLNELYAICSLLGYKGENNNNMTAILDMTKYLTDFIDNILITMGKNGVLFARKKINELNNNDDGGVHNQKNNIELRMYNAQSELNVINVSGAGDCLAAGFIYSKLKGVNDSICMSVAFESAKAALMSEHVVPKKLFNTDHECWSRESKYEYLIQ